MSSPLTTHGATPTAINQRRLQDSSAAGRTMTTMRPVLQTTTLIALAGAIGRAEARAQVDDEVPCAPAAIVGGEAREDVAAVLRDRGVGEPADGCPAVEAQVDTNGTGLVITILDGDRLLRRAATPEVAARIIQEAADAAALALLVPFRSIVPGLDVGELAESGPWLSALPTVVPGGDYDIWESVALDQVLGGAVTIAGFSVRPGSYIGPRFAYVDRPFAFGDTVGQESAGGGARVILDVPERQSISASARATRASPSSCRSPSTAKSSRETRCASSTSASASTSDAPTRQGAERTRRSIASTIGGVSAASTIEKIASSCMPSSAPFGPS